jgi:hypothetical protein
VQGLELFVSQIDLGLDHRCHLTRANDTRQRSGSSGRRVTGCSCRVALGGSPVYAASMLAPAGGAVESRPSPPTRQPRSSGVHLRSAIVNRRK